MNKNSGSDRSNRGTVEAEGVGSGEVKTSGVRLCAWHRVLFHKDPRGLGPQVNEVRQLAFVPRDCFGPLAASCGRSQRFTSYSG